MFRNESLSPSTKKAIGALITTDTAPSGDISAGRACSVAAGYRQVSESVEADPAGVLSRSGWERGNTEFRLGMLTSFCGWGRRTSAYATRFPSSPTAICHHTPSHITFQSQILTKMLRLSVGLDENPPLEILTAVGDVFRLTLTLWGTETLSPIPTTVQLTAANCRTNRGPSAEKAVAFKSEDATGECPILQAARRIVWEASPFQTTSSRAPTRESQHSTGWRTVRGAHHCVASPPKGDLEVAAPGRVPRVRDFHDREAQTDHAVPKQRHQHSQKRALHPCVRLRPRPPLPRRPSLRRAPRTRSTPSTL